MSNLIKYFVQLYQKNCHELNMSYFWSWVKHELYIFVMRWKARVVFCFNTDQTNHRHRGIGAPVPGWRSATVSLVYVQMLPHCGTRGSPVHHRVWTRMPAAFQLCLWERAYFHTQSSRLVNPIVHYLLSALTKRKILFHTQIGPSEGYTEGFKVSTTKWWNICVGVK